MAVSDNIRRYQKPGDVNVDVYIVFYGYSGFTWRIIYLMLTL